MKNLHDKLDRICKIIVNNEEEEIEKIVMKNTSISISQLWVECKESCKDGIYPEYYSFIIHLSELRIYWRGNDTDPGGDFGRWTRGNGPWMCHD